jgi:hypothetical protein
MVKLEITQRFINIKLIFHGVGISCLAGAVLLELLVFVGISTQGVFMGVEQNPIVLNAEIACTVFCALYLGHVSITNIRSILHQKHN